MSKNINQIYIANPSTTVEGNALMYLGLSPYAPTNDSAIQYDDFFVQIETSLENATGLVLTSDTSSITVGGSSSQNIIESSTGCVIAGNNTINCSISGGTNNTLGSVGAFVTGTFMTGSDNNIGTTGFGNIEAAFVGGRFNSLSSSIDASAIISGVSNSIVGGFSTASCLIGGGQDNVITNGAVISTILGGSNNTIDGAEFGCIISGSDNTTNTDGVIVSGDQHNLTQVEKCIIGGGLQNSITGTGQGFSAILCGTVNTITSSQSSSIVYGQLCSITASTSSFAGGTHAHVTSGHEGCFIIADATASSFNTDSSGQFKGFFSSGYRLLGSNNLSFSGTSAISNGALENNEIQLYVDSGTTDLFAKYKDNVGAVHSIDLSSGGGDVVGPASSTANAVTRFNGVTGKLLEDSVVTLDDFGSFDGVLKIIGRPGTVSTTAKTISILPLDGVISGKGGEIDLIAGAGGPSGGNGGDIYLIAGGGTFTDTDAGNIYLQSNGGIGAGTNGTIFALLDISGDPFSNKDLNIYTPNHGSGTAGAINILSGASTSGGQGGQINITVGDSASGFSGTEIDITAGNSSDQFGGGNNIFAGNGGAGGGSVVLTGGDGTAGDAGGGDIYLRGGAASGIGAAGRVLCQTTLSMASNPLINLTNAIGPADAVAFNQISKLTEVTNAIHTSTVNGNDISGTGSLSHPFLTVLAAETSITTNTGSNNVVIEIEAGTYGETSLPIKPFTALLGDGFLASSLNINGGAGDITLDNTGWTGVNGGFSIDGIGINSGINFDFTAAGAIGCFGTIQNVFISGSSTFLGVNGASVNVILFNTAIESGSLVFDSMTGNCLNSVISGASATIQTTVDDASFVAQGAVINGDLILTSSGGFSVISQISSTRIDGNLIIDGANTTLVIDAASYKIPTFTGGATSAQVTITNQSSGTYIPTLTNTTNLSASTPYQCQYMRVGNTVTFSGRVDVDPILAGVDTVLTISLPLTSTFAAEENCSGTAYCPSIAAQGAAILGTPASNTAQMEWVSAAVTNQPMYFSATYLII